MVKRERAGAIRAAAFCHIISYKIKKYINGGKEDGND